ncbi:MAG: flagellin FliC3 [Blautia sp.]|nr:flagellin FliC3 [Lachnoclostridium sp.]MCM1212359.1 flagellin FliC3 [Blautia sp.]
MRINYNATAMRANNSLNVADNRVSSSLQKLSSGLKLNSAKDSPSGYAIGRRMNAQIEGISVATQNSNTGISIIETADGALTEVHSMLQRMNELAIKGATGTLTTSDRMTLNAELVQLKDEVTRIARDTEFNGQTLLDGSFELKGYTNNLDVKVGFYSDDVPEQEYTINALTIFYDDEGKIDLDRTKNSFTPGAGFPNGAEISSVGENCVTITDDKGFELTLDIGADPVPNGSVNLLQNTKDVTTGATGGPLKLDITGIGAMDMQIGANEGQVLEIRIPTISLQRLGITNAELTTQDKSSDAIEAIKFAIAYVSDVRSRLGAYQNRLEHTVSNLDITNENMTSAYSRIMDVDMSEEMTSYTTQQVVSQAAVSMLAQANERPSQVLQLLQ